MSKISSILVLSILASAAFLNGCGVSDGQTATDVHKENVAASFDVNDVPSLNLPADQREPGRLWCEEHDRYENECYICHPELIPKTTPASQSAQNETTADVHMPDQLSSTVLGSDQNALMCNEHRLAEAECGICQADRLASLSVGEGMKIRFASNLSTSKAGVTTGLPVKSSSTPKLELLGQISFNRNQLALVAPLGAGVITEVIRDVGDTVKADEVLAIVHSRDIAGARTKYIRVLAESNLAKLTLSREQDLHKKKISARQDLEQAQAAVAVAEAAITEARQNLHNLGLSEEEITMSDRPQKDMSSLAVRAPFSATVIERSAVLGTAVESGEKLFMIADLSTMWMQLSISEMQLASIQEGAIVQARFDAYTGISFDGEITWISPTVNPDNRMLQARVVLANPQGLLKEGMFGRASLAGFAERNTLSVSAGAIQNIDGKTVVFRKLEDDLFESRLIATGATRDGSVIVLAGLAPNDEIVTEGSYIVKSELLKARLGAGCVDD